MNLIAYTKFQWKPDIQYWSYENTYFDLKLMFENILDSLNIKIRSNKWHQLEAAQ